MKKLALVLTLASVLAPAPTRAQNAYITNSSSNTVSVIDTATNTVSATIPVGVVPIAVAVTPDGSKVYVTNTNSFTVSVIDTATNTVSATIPLGPFPEGVAVSPDGTKVYVAVFFNTVSVIDTATNTVSATVPVGVEPIGVAVTPDGGKVYVTNTAGVGDVSVIDTATNTVIATIPDGLSPVAFGAFIQVAPSFAGVPGSNNCLGTSFAGLAKKFGGLNAAAAAMGSPACRHCEVPFSHFVRDSGSRLSGWGKWVT